MAVAADLRRIALALPEAYEDLHRRRPAFRVRRRIFAMLGVTANTALFSGLDRIDVVVVKLGCEDQLNMVAAYPASLRPTESYGHHGWTYVDLPALDQPALATLTRLAWTHVAPKEVARRELSGSLRR